MSPPSCSKLSPEQELAEAMELTGGQHEIEKAALVLASLDATPSELLDEHFSLRRTNAVLTSAPNILTETLGYDPTVDKGV